MSEAIRHLEQKDIGLTETSEFYGIPVRTLSTRWKPGYSAEKNLDPSGMSSFFMWTTFNLIKIFQDSLLIFCLFLFQARLEWKRMEDGCAHQRIGSGGIHYS